MMLTSTMSSEEALCPAEGERGREQESNGDIIGRATEQFHRRAAKLVRNWDPESMQMLQNLYRALYLLLVDHKQDPSWLMQEYQECMPALLQRLKIADSTRGNLPVLPTTQIPAIYRLKQDLEQGTDT